MQVTVKVPNASLAEGAKVIVLPEIQEGGTHQRVGQSVERIAVGKDAIASCGISLHY